MSKLCDADLNKNLKRNLTNISEDFYEEGENGETERFYLPGNKQLRKAAVTFEN